MTTQRSIARLPLDLFAGIISETATTTTPSTNAALSDLRATIAAKAQRSLNVTTAGALACANTVELVHALDLLTYAECRTLQQRLRQHVCCCCCAPQTAWRLYQEQYAADNDDDNDDAQNRTTIPTGIPAVDAYLRGGITKGTVTELVGAPATAKTQLALQVACHCISHRSRSGSRSSCIYLDTERKVSLQRWAEIANGTAASTTTSTTTAACSSLEHAMLCTPQNLEELEAYLQTEVEDDILAASTTTDRPVQLIVLDSIAAPTRRAATAAGSTNNNNVTRRTLRMAQTLKRLAHQYQLAIVVVNQVSSSSNSSSSSIGEENDNAALGTAWYHCVSTRLRLDHPNPSQPERRIAVSKSNRVAPSGPIPFHVTQQGLMGIVPGHQTMVE